MLISFISALFYGSRLWRYIGLVDLQCYSTVIRKQTNLLIASFVSYMMIFIQDHILLAILEFLEESVEGERIRSLCDIDYDIGINNSWIEFIPKDGSALRSEDAFWLGYQVKEFGITYKSCGAGKNNWIFVFAKIFRCTIHLKPYYR